MLWREKNANWYSKKASRPNSVYFGSAGTFSVTVYREATTNYNQSNTASTNITITTPVTCYYYDLYYGPDGGVYASYTNCAGGGDFYSFDTFDPGNLGVYAAMICARDGTVSMSNGSSTNTFAGC